MSTFKVLEKIFLFSTMVSDLALELLFGAADMVVPHVDRQQLTAPTVQQTHPPHLRLCIAQYAHDFTVQSNRRRRATFRPFAKKYEYNELPVHKFRPHTQLKRVEYKMCTVRVEYKTMCICREENTNCALYKVEYRTMCICREENTKCALYRVEY